MRLLLLAQTARRESLTHAQEWFTRDNPLIIKQIAGVFIVVGMVILLVWLLTKWQSRLQARGCNPMRLYLKMQARLGLSWSDRWRLWRLARRLKLEHPTAVLISAPLFDEAVSRYRQEGGRAANNSATVKALAAVRARLFPDPAKDRIDESTRQ
jgi:hypothetical protein